MKAGGNPRKAPGDPATPAGGVRSPQESNSKSQEAKFEALLQREPRKQNKDKDAKFAALRWREATKRPPRNRSSQDLNFQAEFSEIMEKSLPFEATRKSC